MTIDFQTEPVRYRHWSLDIEGKVARLILDVSEDGGQFEGYQLKLNSYDLSVDIELYDALQRLRFEQPQVRVVRLESGKERVFCAGANIRMLASASHSHKVNFCKFTNETRNAIEDASRCSGLKFITVIDGSCAGGGYEMALATDHIILIDDGFSSIALPEIPLLAVLPGTGGLTRITDKRKVRRDLADVFATLEEGVKGPRALQWGLVDESVPASDLAQVLERCTAELADYSNTSGELTGITLAPIQRAISEDRVEYSSVCVAIDRPSGVARLMVSGPLESPPMDMPSLVQDGSDNWLLRCARELDDALLHLRFNEPEIGVVAFETEGDPVCLLEHDAFLAEHSEHWLTREIILNWKRVFKRIDLTSRSLVALVAPGSCFAGLLVEILLACDRSYMLAGRLDGDDRPPPTVCITESNLRLYPMSNDLTRLQTRFLGQPQAIATIREQIAQQLEAEACQHLGLVTFALDDLDFEDEVRLFLEERAAFSPDAMVGMESNLRFPGPETMETKIFGRLSAWQNWIFQRPNAAGERGALRRYGSGQKGEFNNERI